MTTTFVAHASHLGADRLEGPLKGYHHNAYAVRLEPDSPLAKEFRWLKLREPRPGILWYDLRQFPSEESVLEHLYGRVPRVPRVSRQRVDGGWLTFAGFIEGVTLDRVPGPAGRVAGRFLDQLQALFAALAAIDPRSVGRGEPFTCDHQDHQVAGDTAATAFLRTLAHFSEDHAYGHHRAAAADLLAELGVPDSVWRDFGARLPQLTDRGTHLIHGDLHRRNLVVDRAGGLWTIDWELALTGDPLYDLATHLHLMAYRPDQEQDMIDRWKRAVGPDAARGADADLAHYRDYKRIQSVFTDVIRGAARLAADPRERVARGTAVLAHRALTAARGLLGTEKVPPLPAIEAAFRAWCQAHPEAAEPARAGGVPVGGVPAGG